MQVQTKRVLTEGNGKIIGGGRLVFGQELDSVDGLFSKSQGLSGDLADILLVNELMSLDNVNDYMNCQLDLRKYSWLFSLEENVGEMEAKGSFRFFNVTKKDICEKISSPLLPYPLLLTYEKATLFCKSVSGILFTPTNEYEDLILDTYFLDILGNCPGSYSTNYWLGIRAEVSRNEWISTWTNLEIHFSNFAQYWDDVDPSHQCVTKGYYFNGWWYKTPCDMTACPVCSYNTSVINIFGLCDKSNINSELYLEGMRNSKWSYLGRVNTKMMWTNYTWELTNNNVDTRLELLKSNGLLPLGRHMWSVNEDKCMESRVSERYSLHCFLE